MVNSINIKYSALHRKPYKSTTKQIYVLRRRWKCMNFDMVAWGVDAFSFDDDGIGNFRHVSLLCTDFYAF